MGVDIVSTAEFSAPNTPGTSFVGESIPGEGRSGQGQCGGQLGAGLPVNRLPALDDWGTVFPKI